MAQPEIAQTKTNGDLQTPKNIVKLFATSENSLH